MFKKCYHTIFYSHIINYLKLKCLKSYKILLLYLMLMLFNAKTFIKYENCENDIDNITVL